MDEAGGEDTITGTPAKILKKHKPPIIIIQKHLNTSTKAFKRASNITKAGLDI